MKSKVNSLFNSICYRFDSTIVDPGDEWEAFHGVTAVLLTHGHFDHIYGLNRVVELNPSVVVYTNDSGREALLNDRKNMSRYHDTPYVFQYPDNIRLVNDGETIPLAPGLAATACFTPGHNPGCITWIVGETLFTGDSYIPGIKTVTTLPGGDKTHARQSEQIIRELAQGRNIYPGHKSC